MSASNSRVGAARVPATDSWRASLLPLKLRDPELRILAELKSLHSEPHRRYHNLQHVLDCLHFLKSYPIDGVDAASLEIAFWFHDAVYKPPKSGNELASAEMAVQRLETMGAHLDLRHKIHRLIMATTHDADPTDIDEAVMIDVDLTILGRDRSSYEAYESNIRTEYRLVPRPLFRRKRKAILESFLARTSIYNTEVFRRQFEATAVANLKWAISRL